MIVSYYSIFQQKSILWLSCMYYSDESSRVKQGRGGERAGCTKYALKQTCVKALSNSLRQYRIILSADTASEVRQMLSQKHR